MIRILHTADWHIGHNFFGYDRTSEHLHFFDWLSKQLKINKVDVLLVAGDIFDTMNPSAASQMMFYRFIKNAKTDNPNLQMVFIAGNNDSPARLEAPMPLLFDMDVIIKGQVQTNDTDSLLDDIIIPLAGDSGKTEALLIAVPHIPRENCPFEGGMEELYNKAIQKALEQKTDDQKLIIMGHLHVDGAEVIKASYNERPTAKDLNPISPDVFGEGVTYAALGHLHKAQTIDGKENIRYSGSPFPLLFSERDNDHGAVLVTINQGNDIDIQELKYEIPVPLISIPAEAPATLNEVLKLLDELPECKDNSFLPYIEVKILLQEPEPMLRIHLENSLKGKAVRLARIITAYRHESGLFTEEEIMTLTLQDMAPLQIARTTYEKIYQEEMPDDLEELFNEVYSTLK